MAISFNALESESVTPITQICVTSTTDTLASPLQAPSKGITDPINLHMQAMNCLARCKALLTANEPVYLFALKDLASAKQAIEALYALEQKLEG